MEVQESTNLRDKYNFCMHAWLKCMCIKPSNKQTSVCLSIVLICPLAATGFGAYNGITGFYGFVVNDTDQEPEIYA